MNSRIELKINNLLQKRYPAKLAQEFLKTKSLEDKIELILNDYEEFLFIMNDIGFLDTNENLIQ